MNKREKTIPIKDTELEIIPMIRERIQPLRPSVTKKKRKLAKKMKDNILCKLMYSSGTWEMLLPINKAILEALKVQKREQIISPAMDSIAKVTTQLVILFLTDSINNAPRKAKEKPAIRALILADCLQISA
jgi:hypothetical protein